MKYLFFLLLLGNIVFYLWETGAGRIAPETEQTQTTPPERIVLLSELPPPAAEAVAESRQETPPPSPSPNSATQEPASISALAQTPPPPTIEAPKPEAPPSAAQAETCRLLGPYNAQRQAQAALQERDDGQRRLKLVKRPTPVETGYLLVYPPADTAEAAQANRKMLMEKGFADAWVVDKGEDRNAVSLAAIHNKARADAALSRYRGQGIPVELRPRLGMAEKWWLEVREAAAPPEGGDAKPQGTEGGVACDPTADARP